jgi:hypothetical protein
MNEQNLCNVIKVLKRFAQHAKRQKTSYNYTPIPWMREK